MENDGNVFCYQTLGEALAPRNAPEILNEVNVEQPISTSFATASKAESSACTNLPDSNVSG